MLAAFMTILTLCGDPVYIVGRSEDGRLLAGPAEYITSAEGPYHLFIDITDQLERDSKGEPVVTIKEVGEAHMCPTGSA